ncbi:hypothetical protein GGS24DRAFT_445072 [Hypoxylon argillaceum]|nr:hypothetical protein GGS24DRAFT_445072 [Hypoxylon argillaceum]
MHHSRFITFIVTLSACASLATIVTTENTPSLHSATNNDNLDNNLKSHVLEPMHSPRNEAIHGRGDYVAIKYSDYAEGDDDPEDEFDPNIPTNLDLPPNNTPPPPDQEKRVLHVKWVTCLGRATGHNVTGAV